jgi:hypothetical protein
MKFEVSKEVVEGMVDLFGKEKTVTELQNAFGAVVREAVNEINEIPQKKEDSR